MKQAKKLASLLLALVMVLALATTAFAAEEKGSITIRDAIAGQDYTIYRILDLESYNEVNNTYAYKAATKWSTFINSTGIKNVYVDVDDQGYVTWHKVDGKDADPVAFAKAAQKYAKDNGIENDGTAAASSTTVSFTNLDLGYYLVDSTLGTLCSLDTTNPNVTMEEKNEVPTNVKTVEEDSNTTYGNKNDADIGQTVNFKSTITAQAGAENYVFHDKMSSGLTYGSVTGITLNGKTVENASNANYSVVSTGFTDGCTFEVRFTKAFCDSLKANDSIVISYTATVNKNAVIGGVGNPNESKVSYGDQSHSTTTPASVTKTYTWSFDVLKYGNDDKNNVLEGAQFVLLNKNKDKVATFTNNKLTGWVDLPGEGAAWNTNSTLTTDTNGKITIEGLDADTYYLHETVAPDGYNKLASDFTVTIAPTESEDGKSLTLVPVTAEVANQSGTELPSTGGIGTTIFYVLGSILVIGAAVLLVTKKRMSAKD